LDQKSYDKKRSMLMRVRERERERYEEGCLRFVLGWFVRDVAMAYL